MTRPKCINIWMCNQQLMAERAAQRADDDQYRQELAAAEHSDENELLRQLMGSDSDHGQDEAATSDGEFSNNEFAYDAVDGAPVSDSDDEVGGGFDRVGEVRMVDDLHMLPPPLEADGGVAFDVAAVRDIAAPRPTTTKTNAQTQYGVDKLNVELAVLMARLLLKREDIASLLRLLSAHFPGVMPSHYFYKRVLESNLPLVPIHTAHVTRARGRNVELDLSYRDPIALLAALVDQFVRDGVDLHKLFDAQPVVAGRVPLSVNATPLYTDACAYLRRAINASFIPVFFEMYADEYHIDKQKHKACALRIVLVADRSLMREVCTFALEDFSVDDVLRAVIRPAVAQLERGVRVKCSDNTTVNICGSLYGALGDMEMRWQYLGLVKYRGVQSDVVPNERWNAMLAGTVAVRDLRQLAARANTASCVANFTALGMRPRVPELLTSHYRLFQSSIFRLPPCIMHQWSTGLIKCAIEDVGEVLGVKGTKIVNKRIASVQFSGLNVPKSLYKERMSRLTKTKVVKPLSLNAQEHDHVLKVLPELLIAVPRSDQCISYLMSLINYLEVASRPNHAVADLVAADWERAMNVAWRAYLTAWSGLLPRRSRPRQRKRARAAGDVAAADADVEAESYSSDDESESDGTGDESAEAAADGAAESEDADDADAAGAVADGGGHGNGGDGDVEDGCFIKIRPKMIDNALMARVILAAGPACDYSGRLGEQQHQIGKMIAELRSQRRGDVCCTVLQRRSVFEVLGSVTSARAALARVDDNVVRPFTFDSKPASNNDMQWLRDRLHVKQARAATGFHLGRHRVYFGDFLHIITTQGTHVWGILENCFIIEARTHAVAFGGGSTWLLTLLEFTVADHPITGSLCATPRRTQQQGETVVLFETHVAVFERRLAFQFAVNDENQCQTYVSKRVDPISASLAPIALQQ